MSVAIAAASVFGKGYKVPEYSVSGAGSGVQGTYIVEVSVVTGDKNLSDHDLKLAAVHGVLFRGFSDLTSGASQKPLAGGIENEAENASYYEEFFGKKGKAADFADIVPSSRGIMKSGKKHKVWATVAVRKDALRKYLENAGVVKKLDSYF